MTFAVAEDAREAAVPVLLLQPLVENAIQHGLAAPANAGRIEIGAHRTGARLTITVTDDGPGVTGEALSGREGTGLGNTRARLEALYGGDQRLSLTNAPGGGARVSLEIPLRLTPRGL